MLNHFEAMNSIYNIFEANTKFISKKHMMLAPAMGRADLIAEMFDAIGSSNCTDVRVQSIIEKYGRMDVYYEGGNDALYAKIKRIMDVSINKCAVCGKDIVRNQYVGMTTVKCDHGEAQPSTINQLKELEARMKKITRSCMPEFEF